MGENQHYVLSGGRTQKAFFVFSAHWTWLPSCGVWWWCYPSFPCLSIPGTEAVGFKVQTTGASCESQWVGSSPVCPEFSDICQALAPGSQEETQAEVLSVPLTLLIAVPILYHVHLLVNVDDISQQHWLPRQNSVGGNPDRFLLYFTFWLKIIDKCPREILWHFTKAQPSLGFGNLTFAFSFAASS